MLAYFVTAEIFYISYIRVGRFVENGEMFSVIHFGNFEIHEIQ